MLEPPSLFAAVEQNIYRFSSLDLTPACSAFLRTLKLKKILVLSAERPSKTLLAFADENGIELTHYGLTADGDVPQDPLHRGPDELSPFVSPAAISRSIISERTIKRALHEVLDVSNQPIAICDPSGMQESGVLVGCLRRLQRWNFASILVEYRSFAGSRSRAAHERFIETFPPACVRLNNPPHWLHADTS